MSSRIWSVVIVLVVALGMLWFLGRASVGISSKSNQTAGVNATSAKTISATETFHDFGTISMAAGKVNHIYKIKNAGPESVTVSKLYTSCMCTTALLKWGGGERGPFGMPGHMPVPDINVTLPPGGEAEVEVVFDPAAHGPAGVGTIERVVYVETGSGPDNALELSFRANVIP